MRNATSRLLPVALLSGATGLFALGHPAEVRAQSLFCPAGFTLQSGACTDDAGLSGAALASQALSELSQTTTQTTTQEAKKGLEERRDQERNRCAEGFTRVGGECQPIRPPVPEKTAVAPPPGPPPSPKIKKAKKPKGAAVRPEKEYVPPPPAIVCKDQPCAPIPPPIPVEPAVRFATWAQVYGDYEKRSATGTTPLVVTPSTPPVSPSQVMGLDLDVHSQTGTIGFLAGADLTSRGVLYGNDGLITGVMAGYVSSNLNLQTSATPFTPVSGCGASCTEASHLHANLAGPSAGLFATYFNGPFSTDVTLKVDVLSLNETFTDSLAIFTPGGGVFTPPGGCDEIVGCPFPFPPNPRVSQNRLVAGAGSTHLLNATVAGNANYRFDLQNNFWIEPTAGVQYTNSTYSSDAANLGLADGYLLMVQGGARVGTSSLLWNNVLMTTILTGLAYDDVLVKGGFIAGGPFLPNNILAHADEGQVRGRGILALNFDFGQGISSFVQGEARGGKGLFGAGGKAGVRYVW